MKKAEGYVIRKLEEEYVLIPCGERAEEIPLAVVAAVLRIAPHRFLGQDIHFQHGQLHPQLRAEPPGVGKLKGRLKYSFHKIRPHLRAMLHRLVQQIRRIRAS